MYSRMDLNHYSEAFIQRTSMLALTFSFISKCGNTTRNWGKK
jgi:hypothetical protein